MYYNFFFNHYKQIKQARLKSLFLITLAGTLIYLISVVGLNLLKKYSTKNFFDLLNNPTFHQRLRNQLKQSESDLIKKSQYISLVRPSDFIILKHDDKIIESETEMIKIVPSFLYWDKVKNQFIFYILLYQYSQHKIQIFTPLSSLLLSSGFFLQKEFWFFIIINLMLFLVISILIFSSGGRSGAKTKINDNANGILNSKSSSYPNLYQKIVHNQQSKIKYLISLFAINKFTGADEIKETLNEILADTDKYKNENLSSNDLQITLFAIQEKLELLIDKKKVEFYGHQHLQWVLELKDQSALIESKKFQSVFIIFPLWKLENIISNLINNAVDAFETYQSNKINTQYFRIVVAIEYGNDKVKILVKDNGPGINKEIQEHLMHAPYSSKKNGRGIGLWEARHEVLKYRGSFEIISDENQGTIIELGFKHFSKTDFELSSKIIYPIKDSKHFHQLLEQNKTKFHLKKFSAEDFCHYFCIMTKLDSDDNFQIILIDDDEFYGNLFKKKISQLNVPFSFHWINSQTQFDQQKKELSTDSVILIDELLWDDKRGSSIAFELYFAGFQNLISVSSDQKLINPLNPYLTYLPKEFPTQIFTKNNEIKYQKEEL